MASSATAPPPPVLTKPEEAPEDVICSICMNISTNPVLTPCEHMFCKDCIHQALERNQCCPNDRRACTRDQLRSPQGFVLRVWSNINVKCGHHDIGCEWAGSIGDYVAHTQVCDALAKRVTVLEEENARLKQVIERERAERERAQDGMRCVPPTHPPYSASSEIVKHGKTNLQLVEHYTSQYRGWAAVLQRANVAQSVLHTNNAQQEAELEGRIVWATRNASDSAALALYHLKASMALQNIGDRPPDPLYPSEFSISSLTTSWASSRDGLKIAMMQCIQNLVQDDAGVHINEITSHLSIQGYNASEIRGVMNELAYEGHIYSTIDDDHWQYAE